MKELLILRHAKSSWKDPSLDDHDRPLNKRGKKASKRMGQLLADEGIVPDLILSSTARRARRSVRQVLDGDHVQAVQGPSVGLQGMSREIKADRIEFVAQAVHGRLISRAPAICEYRPIDVKALGLSEGLDVANDGRPPVDHGARYIEVQCLHMGELRHRTTPSADIVLMV